MIETTTSIPLKKTAFERLQRAELVQLAAGLILGLALFLPWYATDPATPAAAVEGHTGDVTAWTAHPTLRWFLVGVVVLAVWSAVQSLLRQQPTPGVARGESSVVVAVMVAGLVLFFGWVDRPGEPAAAIDLGLGWFVALAASLVGLAAAAARMPAPKRTPPGT